MDWFSSPTTLTYEESWRTDRTLFLACTSTSVFLQRYWSPSPGVVPSYAALTLLFCPCAYCLLLELIIKRQSQQEFYLYWKKFKPLYLHCLLTFCWCNVSSLSCLIASICETMPPVGGAVQLNIFHPNPTLRRVPNAWEETRDNVNCTTNGPAKEQKHFLQLTCGADWGVKS